MHWSRSTSVLAGWIKARYNNLGQMDTDVALEEHRRGDLAHGQFVSILLVVDVALEAKQNAGTGTVSKEFQSFL